MNRNLKDIENSHIQGVFANTDTVTIQLFDRSRSNVTPASPADECVEFGTSGVFQWPYANLEEIPSDYEEYTWIMTNQASVKQNGGDIFSIHSPTVFMIPFDVEIDSVPINKGDSWEPEFRLETNSSNLKVGVEITDMDVTFNKYTSNISGGGNDQILLLAEAQTFQIFRLFLSKDETKSFASRYIDVTISAETQSGQKQTIKKKVPFTQVSALLYEDA